MPPLNYSHRLLKNIHIDLPLPERPGETFLIGGDYRYYHYGCDGFDDRGWGCGYRTLQLISSWIATQLPDRSTSEVPSISSIQELLVSMEDKPSSFIGSREWIGTYEVCLVIEKLFDVPSKILHVKRDDKLTQVLLDIKKHFEHYKSPIMIGGDMDCSSKGVVGIHCDSEDSSSPAYLLIVNACSDSMQVKDGGDSNKSWDHKMFHSLQDPHFSGVAKNAEELQGKGWVKWVSSEDFMDSSFYNVCLPQMKLMAEQGDA